jgi:hypothetical protein
MSAGSADATRSGAYIVITGLAIQLLFFGFFMFVAFLSSLGALPKPHQHTRSSSREVPERPILLAHAHVGALRCLYYSGAVCFPCH